MLTQFNLHPQDVPSDGLFIAPPSSLEELVYIRTLTYGVTAYFVIASNNSYQNVLEAFKNSFMDESHNPNGTLHESQIILLTISGINQEASIKLTFNDLNRFLKNPFINGNTYGEKERGGKTGEGMYVMMLFKIVGLMVWAIY